MSGHLLNIQTARLCSRRLCGASRTALRRFSRRGRECRHCGESSGAAIAARGRTAVLASRGVCARGRVGCAAAAFGSVRVVLNRRPTNIQMLAKTVYASHQDNETARFKSSISDTYFWFSEKYLEENSCLT